MKKIEVLPDPEQSTEVLAQEIENISKAVEKIFGGRLSEDAIVLLVHDLLPGGAARTSKKVVKEVLHAFAGIGKFVVPPGTNLKRKVSL